MSGTCIPLATSRQCSQWRDYSILAQTDTPFSTLEEFDAFIESRQNTNSIPQFQEAYGCPGWQGSGLRYHTTTYCGMFVWAASARCNPTGIAITTCRSSADAFFQSANILFTNPEICSTTPSPQQELSRVELLNTVQNFVNALPVDDPLSPTPPTDVCILANSDVPAELQTCGFYEAPAADAFCAANPLQACCRNVPGFVPPEQPVVSTSTSAAAARTSTSAPAAASSTTSFRPIVGFSSTTSSSSTATNTQASTSNSTAATDQKILGLSLPIFIGALVGGTVVIIALVVGLVLCARRRKGGKSRASSMVYNNAGNAKLTPPGGAFGAPPPEKFATSPSEQGQSDVGYADRGFQEFAGQQGAPMSGGYNASSPGNNDMMYENGNGGMRIAGAAAGGAALSRGAAAAAVAAQNGDNGETMEAVFNYVPNLSDEIYLYVGDPVIVKCQFDDGWGYGFNMTTQQEGAFPLACVAPYGTNESGQRNTLGGESVNFPVANNATGGADPSRSSFTIRQRQSSMFGPPPGFRETMYTDAGPEMGNGGGFQGR
ncbi:hypothetical protein HDU67_009720 [Dinochytrium kinnereticum]|nr:hypothetical protein HDU67_009720 [Dinochytrium kinnereticum]